MSENQPWKKLGKIKRMILYIHHMNKSNCHLINQQWFYRDFDKQLNKIHPKLFLYPKVNHPHGLFDKMENQSTKRLGSLPDSYNGLPVQFPPPLQAPVSHRLLSSCSPLFPRQQSKSPHLRDAVPQHLRFCVVINNIWHQRWN